MRISMWLMVLCVSSVGVLAESAAGTGNVLPPMRDALRARATVGEVCDALREVWGLYHPAEQF